MEICKIRLEKRWLLWADKSEKEVSLLVDAALCGEERTGWISGSHHLSLAPLCPAAIPSRSLAALPAVVDAMWTKGVSQLHKLRLALCPHGRTCCTQEMWDSLHIQVKSISSQGLLGSADLDNSLHIDPFETLKNWVASSFHPNCGTYCFRKQN